MRQLSVDTIDSEAAFLGMGRHWNALVSRTASPNLFLTHEWFRAAWAWRRLDARLHVLAVRDGDALIGVLPLISDRAAFGRARALTLLTVPDTQYCDLIADAVRLPEVVAALAQTLAARRDWDNLALHYLPADGTIVRGLVPAMAALGALTESHCDGRNALIRLDDDWDTFYGDRSRSLKRANNLAGNRLHRSGAVRIEHFGANAGSERQLDDVIDTVVDISSRSWKRATGNSLDQSGPGAFIRELSSAAWAQGWLSVWLLHLDDRAVAMEFQLDQGGNVYALRADFDANCTYPSPGTYLQRYLIERLFDQRHRCYFMGPGNNAYKARWTDQATPLCGAHVYNRTVSGRAMGLWQHELKPRLRNVLAR